MVLSCLMGYVPYALVIAGLYFLVKFVQNYLLQKKLERWSNTPKDLIIVHGVSPTKSVPNPSPFVLKLETFLRMANLPYKMDNKDSFGPKGKTPWISINGEHISDSELIIKFLSKKYEKNLNGSYSPEKVAIGTAMRVMLEDHLFWGLARSMFIDGDNSSSIMSKINIPSPRFLIVMIFRWTYARKLKTHGLGAHTREECYSLIADDLLSLGNILGKNEFILGSQPCLFDAVAFGFLAQFVWGFAGETREGKFILDQFPNIKNYCYRMKEKYWADWDSCLEK